jgi:kynurenine formamidase
MRIQIAQREKKYWAHLDKPLSIGILLRPGAENPNCFYADPPIAEPVTSGDFIGSVSAGSAVNFYRTTIIPHGNGTHTECLGHISADMESVAEALTHYHFMAEVISVSPEPQEKDQVISKESLVDAIRFTSEALIIRTLPNSPDKQSFNYSGSNPPYLTEAAMNYIVEKEYKHLLLDLPSVDREEDGGLMIAHKRFWNFSARKETTKTITELIFVDDQIEDGLYLLNLQIANIELDAVMSNPVVYRLEEVK